MDRSPEVTREGPRTAAILGVEPNVAAISAAVFLMGLGEELWKRFIPKYLAILGAPVAVIGVYGSVRDFADGALQYPGGAFADRFGRRRALQLFISFAAIGYLLYLVAPSWPLVLVGLPFVMMWSSAASPTMFAVIGDALAAEHRTMGFTIQSILRRIPIMVAPALGGILVATLGVRSGVQVGLLFALALAVMTFLVVSRIALPPGAHVAASIIGVWGSIPSALRRLLASDILVRTCEGLADVFVVLYAIDVIGVTAPQFGLLVAIQMATSIAVYAPAAALARRIGPRPLVIGTFVAFALFPVAVAWATGFASLALAFVIGGLREIGEPARKAMIVGFAAPHARARTVGLYYLLRSVAISPAAAIGGILWSVAPTLPFMLAGAFGVIGAVVFGATVRDKDVA